MSLDIALEVHEAESLNTINESEDVQLDSLRASNNEMSRPSQLNAVPRQPLKPTASSSSESEDSNDSDDDDALRWKRPKLSRKQSPAEDKTNSRSCEAFTLCATKFSEDRKLGQRPSNKFSVWSNVLAEQGLVEDLNSVEVENLMRRNDRGCEGYNYALKNKYPGQKPLWQQDSREIHRRLGCKRSAKERLGELSTLRKDKRAFSISENDSDEVVVNGIATILREPKQDLIARTVKTVGKKKALEILAMAEDIEECGGMMTVDGSRRRTPGGIFLLLLRNDFYITKDDLDVIFEQDRKLQTMAKKEIIRAKRRKAAQALEKSHGPLPLKELPTLPELIMREQQLKQELAAKEQMDVNNEDGEQCDSEKEPGEIESD